MVTESYLTELVRRFYFFLETDFGFEYIGTDETPRIIDVKYRNKELMVIVRYSRVNRYIEVDICNQASLLDIHSKHKYCAMLMGILKERNPEFDYDAIMPSMIPLEESIEKTSALLKYYGAGMLSGKEQIQY